MKIYAFNSKFKGNNVKNAYYVPTFYILYTYNKYYSIIKVIKMV